MQGKLVLRLNKKQADERIRSQACANSEDFFMARCKDPRKVIANKVSPSINNSLIIGRFIDAAKCLWYIAFSAGPDHRPAPGHLSVNINNFQMLCCFAFPIYQKESLK